MEDTTIIDLYWRRDQEAITETARKYGSYLDTIAMNILHDHEDSQECVNDTYLSAWNAMPPHRPSMLRTFLGKLTRNLAFNRYKRDHAEKRGGGEITLVLDELGDCVSGRDDVEASYDRKLLLSDIHRFLQELTELKRRVFLCRYWYADSISSIAQRFSLSENNVSVMLSRLRTKLRQYLWERGHDL